MTKMDGHAKVHSFCPFRSTSHLRREEEHFPLSQPPKVLSYLLELGRESTIFRSLSRQALCLAYSGWEI